VNPSVAPGTRSAYYRPGQPDSESGADEVPDGVERGGGVALVLGEADDVDAERGERRERAAGAVPTSRRTSSVAPAKVIAARTKVPRTFTASVLAG